MQHLTKWLKTSIWLLILGLPLIGSAQTLSLEEVYQQSRAMYPLLKQKQLVQQTAALNIDNLSKGFLPQININAQASYQSAVTALNISFPGVSIQPLSKDQYRITADISQVLYDGGVTKQQQQLQQLNAAVEDQKLEVELYKLKERVTQIYLSTLFIDAQLKQVDLIRKDIETGLKRVQAQVDNGIAFKSNINLLKAELIKTEQRAIELTATKKGLIDVLGLFLQQSLPENTQLTTPAMELVSEAEILRPELTLFTNQGTLLEQQNQLIKARNQPKASAFLQGGYGRPGLNMLKNAFEPFGIGGVRFNWSLGGLYTRKKEKQLIAISQQAIGIQKETFLLQTQTQLRQQQAEISKLQQLIATDKAIIDLRLSVKEAANAQLENGVITANDYLREVNAEDQARQLLVTHQVQLLQAQINLKLITGK